MQILLTVIKDKPTDIMIPLDSFSIEKNDEIINLVVSHGHYRNEYLLSEAQYDKLTACLQQSMYSDHRYLMDARVR